jgi:osmotically inducible protein OsmC
VSLKHFDFRFSIFDFSLKESNMPERRSEATWEGDLKGGRGKIKVGRGAWEGPYSFTSRFEEGAGTNPEELIAAAHAGCFSMALSHGLAQAGHTPKRVQTTARVQLEKQAAGFAISRVDLETEAEVPGIDENTFRQQADTAKQNCPVSKALGAVPITLNARLVGK